MITAIGKNFQMPLLWITTIEVDKKPVKTIPFNIYLKPQPPKKKYMIYLHTGCCGLVCHHTGCLLRCRFCRSGHASGHLCFRSHLWYSTTLSLHFPPPPLIFFLLYLLGKDNAPRELFFLVAGEAQYEKTPTPHHHIFLLGGLGF